MSNIVGLGSLKKDESKKDPKTTQSYAGGEKRFVQCYESMFSGIAIQNPDDEKPISIIAYEDGFIVDNGAFRPLANNPQNQQFIDDINEGYCPRELMGNRKNPLPIALTDHRNKKYNAAEHKNSSDSCCGGSTSPSKPALEAFSGQARSLGGNTAQASFNANATGEVTVDPSRPSTTLRIRFHNGQQRTQTFNRDAPISQLRAFVNSVAPVSGGNFKLVTGFPPVSLDDESATLESVGVIDTTVIQHL